MSRSLERLRSMSSLQIALAAHEARQKPSADAHLIAHEPIAVIGVGCRLPGGVEDLPSLWRRLNEANSLIDQVPPGRWDTDICGLVHDEEGTAHRSAWRYGAFLENVDAFDADFFGIAPREAASIDPQQRLLLEVVWEALERAGIASPELSGSPTGVFIGASTNDYAQHELHASRPRSISPYALSGTSLNVLAGRVSYWLGLHGPSLVVDTACSSSLVALHLACQSLRWNECHLAIVGGVNLMLAPGISMAMDHLGVLAPDGVARIFDAGANGYVRGEACAVVILRRLSDAIAQGDPVLAVVRGTAVNQDGRSAGLTAPQQASQADVVRQALHNAALQPNDIDYIEAHATGIALGDLVEANAIESVFGPSRPAERPLVVTSSKDIFGHSEAAAGVVGILKVIASLQQETIAPLAHLNRLDARLAQSADRVLRFPRRRCSWRRSPTVRRAGVSAFGFTGTNAHAILEEPPAVVAAAPREPLLQRPMHLLTLRAKNETALRALAARFADRLQTADASWLADACYTANTGRMPLRHRLAVVGREPAQIAQRLRAFAARAATQGLVSAAAPRRSPQSVLRFTGRVVSSPALDETARLLDQVYPTFHQAVNRCVEAGRTGGFSSPWFRRVDPSVAGPAQKQSNHVSHGDCPSSNDQNTPLLGAWDTFVMSFSLAHLLADWGIGAHRAGGNAPLGRLVAACWAGAIPLDQAAQWLAEFPSLWDGATTQAANAALRPEHLLDTLRVDAPGNAWQLPRVALEGLDFHSRDTTNPRPIAEALWQWCLHDESAESADSPSSSSMSEQVARPQVIVAIGAATHHVALSNECDPHGKTASPAKRRIVTLLDADASDIESLHATIGQLFVWGVPIDWHAFDGPFAQQRVELPTYPFQRRRYWVDLRAAPASNTTTPINADGTAAPRNNMSATPITSTTPTDRFSPAASWLAWHREPLAGGFDQSSDAPSLTWFLLAETHHAAPARRLAEHLALRGHTVTIVAPHNQTSTANPTVEIPDRQPISSADRPSSAPRATKPVSATATAPATADTPDSSQAHAHNRSMLCRPSCLGHIRHLAFREVPRGQPGFAPWSDEMPVERPGQHASQTVRRKTDSPTPAPSHEVLSANLSPDEPTVAKVLGNQHATSRPAPLHFVWFVPHSLPDPSTRAKNVSPTPSTAEPASAGLPEHLAVPSWMASCLAHGVATLRPDAVRLWVVTHGAVPAVDDASTNPQAMASRLPVLWQSVAEPVPDVNDLTWIDLDPAPTADDLDLLLDELLHAVSVPCASHSSVVRQTYIAYRDATRHVGHLLAAATSPPPQRRPSPVSRRPRATPPADASFPPPGMQAREASLSADTLQQQVARCLALVLGRGPDEPIDPDTPLGELGLDSLMAVRLVKDLGQLVDRPLPSDVLNRYDTVAALAAFLQSLLVPRATDPP